MGFTSRVKTAWKALTGKKTVTDFTIQEGHRFGLHMAHGRQLEMRLKLKMALSRALVQPVYGETPFKMLKSLTTKVELTNMIVQLAAMAWAKAGDNEKYRRAIKGYESLYTCALTDCWLFHSAIKKQAPIDQFDTVLNLITNLQWLYFEPASYFANMTYFKEEITLTADKTIVFHTVAPQPQYPIYPPTTMQQPRELDEATKPQNWGKPKFLEDKRQRESEQETS